MSSTSLFVDLRLAARALLRGPGFVVTSVLLLALAIGATAVMFSVVRHVLLAPLPYPEPDRLVYIGGSAPGSALPTEFGVSREFHLHYADHSQLIENTGTYNSFTNSLRVDDRVERIWMSAPSASVFATLGIAPALGRLPNAADNTSVVVLSDRLWEEWFDRDPNVLGRNVQVFGAPREVVGIMPPEFRFPEDRTLLWLARHFTEADVQNVGNFGLGTVARLKPGIDHGTLASELTGLSKSLPQRFGGSAAYADIVGRHRAVVRSLEQQVFGPYARPLWLLFGAAALVLLIACANLANLFLVRAEARHRELAVRSALGAGRFQLLRVQLSESVLIGLMAGILAAALAKATLPVLLQWAPPGVPRLGQVGVDHATLAFTLIVSLIAGVLCGTIAALRGSSPSLERLRDGGRTQTSRHYLLRRGLVVSQTALALVLLIGAGLLLRSVHALHSVDPGYDPHDVFTFQFAPDQTSLDNPQSYARFHQDFLARLDSLPGVTSVGLVENVPLNEGTARLRVRTETMAVPAESGTLVSYTYTAGDYFRTMGIRLVSGRSFEADDHESRGNILVSRRAAELLWPNVDAVGKRLQREGQQQWETVVGVVENVLQIALDGEPEPLIYLPLVGPDPATSRPIDTPAYVIKSARAGSIASDVRALIREVAPEAPMYRQYTMEQLVGDSMVQRTFSLLVLGFAAAMALILGVIGLYGVLAYTVSERTREIGVHMALGAQVRQVLVMVLTQGLRMIGLGVLIGLLVAAGVSRILAGQLFGVTAFDLPTFAGMAMIMLLVGLLASYLPAVRAAQLDPMTSLRRE